MILRTQCECVCMCVNRVGIAKMYKNNGIKMGSWTLATFPTF